MSPSFSVLDEFEQLTAALLDGTATPEMHARFNAIAKEYPEFRSVWLDQVRLHALLTCRGEGGMLTVRRTPHPPKRSWRWAFVWKAAALLALLLAGALVRGYGLPQRTTLETAAAAPAPAVRVLSQTGVSGLDLPTALPGKIRLVSGDITVRLASGVEIMLVGPADLNVLDAMQVVLAKGKLAAKVPHWATGFTVRTSELEVWDLGTVFSVAASDGCSEVFVFKGSVQVNAAAGEAVGLCEAGEGVHAERGSGVFKVAADWPASRELFAGARRELAEGAVAAALARASRIMDLWVERYMPEEAWRVRERVAREAELARAARRPPFSKTAWVRPSVSRVDRGGLRSGLPVKEETMKTTRVASALAAATLSMGVQMTGAASEAVPLFVAPHINRGWSTLFTNEVPLQWEWPEAAARAELDVVGMNDTFTTNFTAVTTNWAWQAFAAAVPATEDVYALRLTFFGEGDAVVGALTSQLAVVKGAFGEASINARTSGDQWTRVRENVVIPYDAGWTAATVDAMTGELVIAKEDGLAQTNVVGDASGYFGWKLRSGDWGYGSFDLALTFPETVTNAWDAVLTRLMDGTIIILH